MKKILAICLCAMATMACHKVQFIESNADRQGLTSISAVISSGEYADKVLSKLTVDETTYESGNFVLEIPYFYPETSEDGTLKYMSALRVQAELQPNFRIEPALGLLDLTEPRQFKFINPKGESRDITISAKRVKPSACDLLSFLVEDYMVSGIIYQSDTTLMIPYLNDLSSVKVSGQVSSHATISKISGQKYVAGNKYNLNTGATVTVLAGNGTSYKTYKVVQDIPKLLDYGMNVKSISPLFNIDPVTMCGFPPYTQLSYVSLAGLGSNIVVCLGSGIPYYLNCFTGQKLGQINLGSATADAITSDDAGNMLIVNYAESGQTVNIYTTTSVTDAPILYHTFDNPSLFPIGHRVKVLGDITKDALIVFTCEGIAGVSVTATSVWMKVTDGVVGTAQVKDFANIITANGSPLSGWGSAPVHTATVIPASLDPTVDGWFLDYYEGNCEATEDSSEELYILHAVSGNDKDTHMAHIGNWGNNPNCLDIKTFNHARYMTLFVVSHFPEWGIGPQIYLWDVTDPTTPTLTVSNKSFEWFQIGAHDGDNGASGDVVLCPTSDGYRTYIYYYDHHAQAIGAYVADCFKIE